MHSIVSILIIVLLLLLVSLFKLGDGAFGQAPGYCRFWHSVNIINTIVILIIIIVINDNIIIVIIDIVIIIIAAATTITPTHNSTIIIIITTTITWILNLIIIADLFLLHLSNLSARRRVRSVLIRTQVNTYIHKAVSHTNLKIISSFIKQ